MCVCLVWSQVIPGKVGYGSVTPAGHTLAYNVNGFESFVVVIVLWVALAWTDVLPGTFIADNWGGLVVSLTVSRFCPFAFCFGKQFLSIAMWFVVCLCVCVWFAAVGHVHFRLYLDVCRVLQSAPCVVPSGRQPVQRLAPLRPLHGH